jgi:hypothetical protein
MASNITVISQSNCPNTPASIMSIGIRGRVTFTDGSTTSLRAQPTTSSERLMRMPEGFEFDVIDGPVCADGYNFWQLETDDGLLGWAAEGNIEDTTNNYWIEPAPVYEETSSNPTSSSSFLDQDIIFTRDDGIWIYQAERGQSIPIMTAEQNPFNSEAGSLRCADLSYDSQYLAFVHYHIHHTAEWQIAVLDMNTMRPVSGLSWVTNYFAWSPTENILAFSRIPEGYPPSEASINESGIGILNVEDNAIEFYVQPEEITLSNGTTWLDPKLADFHNPYNVWSPDGTNLAFRYGLHGSEPGYGLAFVNVSEDIVIDEDLSAKFFSWLPDSQHIAYETHGRIFVSELDGRNLEWIIGDSQNPVTAPLWSPDGRYLVYGDSEISNYDGSYYPINTRLLDIENNSIIVLSNEFFASSWSPNGTSLLGYLDGQITVLPVDDSEPVIIGEGSCANWIGVLPVFELPTDYPALAVENTTPAYQNPSEESAVVSELTPRRSHSVLGKSSNNRWLLIYLPEEQSFSWILRTETVIDNGLIFIVPVIPSVESNSNTIIRSGPSIGYGEIGVIDPNSTYLVIGQNETKTWLQILYQDRSGWVCADDVSSRTAIPDMVVSDNSFYSCEENHKPIRLVDGMSIGPVDASEIVFVNGIQNTYESVEASMLAVSEAFDGHPTSAIYNASTEVCSAGVCGGTFYDVLQAVSDINWRITINENPAVDTLLDTILRRDFDLTIVAHSQGGAIVSAALGDLAVLDRDMSNIIVYTFGSAGVSFVPGPEYHHCFHTADLIPLLAHKRSYEVIASELRQTGEVYLIRTEWVLDDAHDLSNYLQTYRSGECS